MKTLTAKLAVAALLVAGATVKADQFSAVLTTAAVAWNVNDASRTVSTNWYAAQASKKKTKLQKSVSAVTNYALPAAQVAAAALLAAKANGFCPCERVDAYVTPTSAIVGLTALTLGNYYWNNRSAAQQAADAAVVSAVEAAAASAEASVQSATSSTTASSTASSN